jgi:NarL family two-component system response regulator LiaR
MSQDKISILIADDHNVVRMGLGALLSKDKYNLEIIGEASDGEEAVQKALQLKPDVILMDLSMPRMDGIQAILEIKKNQPSARILVLTSYSDDLQVAEAMRAGAYGYLLKDTSPDELVQTIRTVYDGKLVLPQTLARFLLEDILADNGQPASNGRNGMHQAGHLTGRELDVLRCLSQGMTNKQIAQQLSVGVTTVRTHIASLMRKLDLQNRTQLALYAVDNHLTSADL